MPARQPAPAAPAMRASNSPIGIDEAELWAMADALRGSMDAAEHKHVVLGLIFLKYISDAFEERHAAVLAEWGEEAAEDPDEYIAEAIFWVPSKARWANLSAQARQATIGQIVDEAMASVEHDNAALKDVLPKDYARPALDKQRLGQLIDMIGNIAVGDEEARANDLLGRVYEYFLGQIAGAEGKKGGEFYRPRSVVRLLVEMLEPYSGRVHDPCCGSSGMFVQSVEFIDAHSTGNGNGGGAPGRGARGASPSHGKTRRDISVWGQESNPALERGEWRKVGMRGSHRQFRHPEKPRPGNGRREAQRRPCSRHREQHQETGATEGVRKPSPPAGQFHTFWASRQLASEH